MGSGHELLASEKKAQEEKYGSLLQEVQKDAANDSVMNLRRSAAIRKMV